MFSKLAPPSPRHLHVSMSLFLQSRVRRLERFGTDLALRVLCQLQCGITAATTLMSDISHQYYLSRTLLYPSGTNVSRRDDMVESWTVTPRLNSDRICSLVVVWTVQGR
jgi:hypothetical protein